MFFQSYMGSMKYVCACLHPGSCVSLSVHLFLQYTVLKCMHIITLANNQSCPRKIYWNYIRKRVPDYEDKLVFLHIIRLFEQSRILKIHAPCLLLTPLEQTMLLKSSILEAIIFFKCIQQEMISETWNQDDLYVFLNNWKKNNTKI